MSLSETMTSESHGLALLRDFYDSLAAADWQYGYSDSAAVYNRGRDQIAALRAQSKATPDMEKLFLAYNDYENRVGPRPERP